MSKFSDENNRLLYEYLVNGDMKAYRKLYEDNLNLINTIIKSIFKLPPEKMLKVNEEYFSLGCVALGTAIQTFDVQQIGKIEFSTYASICIRNAIYLDCRENKTLNSSLFFSEVISEDSEEGLTIEDIIVDDQNVEEDAINRNYSNYRKRIVLEAWEKLSDEEKNIMELYHGLNGNRKISQKELAVQLGISRPTLIKLVDTISKKMAISLDEFREDYQKKDTRYTQSSSLIKKVNEMFLSLFDNQPMEKLLNCVELLKDREKEILILYYGLNKNDCMDYDEIAEKYGISIDKVDYIIETSILKIKSFIKADNNENAFKFYNLFKGYSKEKVDEALAILDRDIKEILTLFYGLDGVKLTSGEIGKKYQIDPAKIYINYIKQGIHKIQNILSGYKTKFYSNFKDYSIEEVDEVLAKIDSQTREMLTLYYGLKDERYSGIELSKKYNLEYKKFQYVLSAGINNIKKILNSSKVVLARQEEFYSLFEGASKEQVDEALSKIEAGSREILTLYYFLDGSEHKNSDIANTYNFSINHIDYYIKKAINLINKELNVFSNSRDADFWKSKFYQKFSQYDSKEVDKCLEVLDKKDNEIVRYYYGLDGIKLIAQEISEKYGIKKSSVSIYVLRCLERINKALYSSTFCRSKQNEFYDKFDNYNRNEVKEALFKLSEKERAIISAYYRLDENFLNDSQIFQMYNIRPENILEYIDECIKKITEILKVQSEHRIEGIFYGEFYGFGKEEVLKSLEILSDMEKEIIKCYYGLNKEKMEISEIANKLNLSLEMVESYKKEAMSSMKKFLTSSLDPVIVRQNKFYEKYSSYNKDQVVNALQQLSDIDRQIISLYYGLEGTILKGREIEEKFNITTSFFNSRVKTGLLTIKKELQFYDSIDALFVNIQHIDEETVLNYLMQIDEENYEVLKDIYELKRGKINLKDLAKSKNISIIEFMGIIDEIIKKINNTIKDIALNQDEFYRKFQFHTKEEIKSALLEIDLIDREILNLYFGLNGEKQTKVFIADKYKIKYNTLSAYVEAIIIKMNGILANKIEKLRFDKQRTDIDDNKKRRQRDFFTYIKINDINKLKNVMMSLDAEELRLLTLYFGLDNRYISSPHELSEALKIEKVAFLIQIKEIINKINKFALVEEKALNLATIKG